MPFINGEMHFVGYNSANIILELHTRSIRRGTSLVDILTESGRNASNSIIIETGQIWVNVRRLRLMISSENGSL